MNSHSALSMSLKIMASSAKAMLFDLYEMKEGDRKYLFYRESGDYVAFFKTMLEKTGNPERYRQKRAFSNFQKGTIDEYKCSLEIADKKYMLEVEENTKIPTQTDFKIYCAIALIECQKQITTLIPEAGKDIDSERAAKIATMTGYIYACFFLLPVDEVEKKVESSRQRDNRSKATKKRAKQILEVAKQVLEDDTEGVYLYTRGKKVGTVKLTEFVEKVIEKMNEGKYQSVSPYIKKFANTGQLNVKIYSKKH